MRLIHVELDHSSKVSAPFMTVDRANKPRRTSSQSAKAVRRAIAKANPTKEPPTVGKPVIIDPARPNPAGSTARQRRKDQDDRR